MNLCLFGGSFDPVHRGHLAVARKALRQFHLDRVLYVPSSAPPHKHRQPLTPFIHRYAMLALATAGEDKFQLSLLESRSELMKTGRSVAYTVDTLRAVRRTLKPSDRLFFLIGVDAFLDIAKWHQADAVLSGCEFIIASRPGYTLAHVAQALPPAMQSAARLALAGRRATSRAPLVLPGVRLHFLSGVHEDVSSTAIRQAAARNGNLAALVPPSVASYIRKQALYRS